MCTERNTSMCGSAECRRVNGLKVYASILRSDRLTTELGSAPDGRRKGPQLEGVPGEYPRERAVSVLMDGHPHAQHEQTQQRA